MDEDRPVRVELPKLRVKEPFREDPLKVLRLRSLIR